MDFRAFSMRREERLTGELNGANMQNEVKNRGVSGSSETFREGSYLQI